MRGTDIWNGSLFSYIDLEARVIRRPADDVLVGMPKRFEAAYAPIGRRSIASELLLLAFYALHSERQLMEPIDLTLRRSRLDLLFR